jgi:hypothetical protein
VEWKDESHVKNTSLDLILICFLDPERKKGTVFFCLFLFFSFFFFLGGAFVCLFLINVLCTQYINLFTLDEGLCPLPTVAEVTVADGVRQGGHQEECLAPSIRKNTFQNT